MENTYQVFCDSYSGMKWLEKLGSNDIEECVDAIDGSGISQHCMYYIYFRQGKVAGGIWGLDPDMYECIRAVPGNQMKKANVELANKPPKYALTIWDKSCWLFSDGLL